MKIVVQGVSLSAALLLFGAQAKSYRFDAALLGKAAEGVDLTLFEQGLQQPGTYRLDVMLNQQQLDSRDIVLRLEKDSAGHDQLLPCLSVAQLERWGVKTADYPGLVATENPGACAKLSAIPQATVNADVANLQLHLEIPQVALRPKFIGLAPQILWDDGITAFRMNYNASSFHIHSPGYGNQTSSWVQLEPGFNVGAWRVRSSYNWHSGGRWQRSYLHAERGLGSLRSRLTLGESTTSGEVFDGVPFTGVMLGTDESMIPASERSFAPAVNGVARTRARIEVRQNGYLLQSLQVAPGPFELRDLPGVSGGGELQVTVYEADGQNQFFTVPWQTPAIALRRGYMKYSLLAGQYRPSDKITKPAPLAMATLMYGLPANLTVYGGVQGAVHYAAASLGLGLSLGHWGAISLDGTGARSQFPKGEIQQGVSWRARYSSRLPLTGTGLSLVTTQYASPGYRSLSETLGTWQKDNPYSQPYSGRQQRAQSSLYLSQPLGALGYLGLNASRTTWRDAKTPKNSYGVSWSKSVRGVALSVNWQQSQTREGLQDRSLNLWLSVPFGDNTYATWNFDSPAQGGQQQEVGLSGRAFDNQLNWNLRERYRAGTASDRSNSSLQLGWSGTYGQVGMNYGYSSSAQQIGADVAGSVIVHRHGVTLSQPLSDTVALVSAPGAAGVKVNGWPGLKTDLRGYAASSGLGSYQENTVSLDPTLIPDDAELSQTDVKVIPTNGAVVRAAFPTRSGARALVTLRHPDGTALGFATWVKVEGEEGSAGMTDSSGLAYLTGLPAVGTLSVGTRDSTCLADYRLPAEKGPAGLYKFEVVCQPIAAKGVAHE